MVNVTINIPYIHGSVMGTNVVFRIRLILWGFTELDPKQWIQTQRHWEATANPSLNLEKIPTYSCGSYMIELPSWCHMNNMPGVVERRPKGFNVGGPSLRGRKCFWLFSEFRDIPCLIGRFPIDVLYFWKTIEHDRNDDWWYRDTSQIFSVKSHSFEKSPSTIYDS